MCFSAEAAFPPGPAIAAQSYPNIRLFAVAMVGADTPQSNFPPLKNDSQCSWNHDKANATNAPSYKCNAWLPSTPVNNGKFSAVCLFTALEIASRYTGNRTIGLIYSAFGGTSISLWAPPTAFAQCPGANASAEAPSGGSLYNAMIAPLAQYSLRSVLWFQGEQDAGTETKQPGWYSCRFAALIDYWRLRWGMGDFTFGFVQLGSVFDASESYGQLRFAQALEEPRPGGIIAGTTMAVAYDLGDRGQDPTIGSVHFRNKTEVARRLALGILHAHFGLQNASILPPSASAAVQTGASSVSFSVLVPDGSPISLTPGGECIECCDAGNTVQLSSDGGLTFGNATMSLTGAVVTATASAPATFTHARFAAMDYVECALTSTGNGLPLPAFILPVAAAPAVIPSVGTLAAAPSPGAAGAGTLSWRGQTYAWTGTTPPPPLGMSTWNAYHDNIDEVLIERVADAFISLGLRDAGFVYVNVDDAWQVSRMENSTIREDPVKFPSSMFALSAAVHARGLRFGLYTSQTALTCQDRPGSYNFEAVDVARWCEWQLDYIKVDNCGGARWPTMNTSWVKIREAMASCAVAPRLSVEYCNRVDDTWCAELVDLWRTTGDVQANFASILNNLDENDKLASLMRPGRYNDADLLVLGNQGVLLQEAQVQFSAWAIVASPLLFSFDVTGPVDSGVLALLTNSEVIAVSQDAAQIQGVRVSAAAPAGVECWARPLAPTPGVRAAVAALIINRAPLGSPSVNGTCTWEDLGLPAGASASVRDLYAHSDAGNATGAITALVPPHASQMFKLIVSL